MTAEVSRLELHMPGLLKLLGESLYSDPRVAYRELIQNAHDSCVRRALADGDNYVPRIEVRFARARQRQLVSIHDNGEGLSELEIRKFLATVGRGGTAQLRASLEQRGDASARDLIGQFGVGLLSAFLVADRVDVMTRRFDEPAGHGYRWVCEGQETYRLEQLERAVPGTTVRLRIRPDTPELGRASVVAKAIRHYGRFLDVPIHVADAPAVNDRRLPWHDDSWGRPRWNTAELVTELDRSTPPLVSFELQPFTHPTLGRVDLRGVLAIPQASRASVLEHGHVAVVLRRMLITERQDGLLPEWARFVTGLVDCPQLRPTASREQLRRDDMFAAVRESLSSQLLRFIGRLRESKPRTWQQIAFAHGVLLKRWAVKSPDLFDAVADHVVFATTRGQRTLPEYVRESGGTLYAISDDQKARTMELLLESVSRPVIEAQGGDDLPFLRLYARRHGLRMIDALEQTSGIVEPCTNADDSLRRLADRLRSPSLRVAISEFDPSAVPAVVLTPDELIMQRRLRAVVGDERLLSEVRGMLGDYLRELSQVRRAPTLHLNARCELVTAIAALPETTQKPAAVLLHQLAQLMAGDRLAPQELVDCVTSATAALISLLDARGEHHGS